MAALGCGDDSSTGGGGTGGEGANQATGGQTTGGQGTGAGAQGGGGASTGGNTSTGGGGAGGEAPILCTAPAESAGDAVAVSPDDSTVVVVNRDVGTVTVFGVDYGSGLPVMTVRAEVPVGNEPWQVVIDPCGTKAYVVLRRDQKVVTIDNLDTTPTLGAAADVGSEPTGLALSPNGTNLYVSNWVEGTVSVVDTTTFTIASTIDLNETLAATGLLGTAVATRPALAHPRSIAISNDGDADDNDETIVVTEFFGQRTAPEPLNQVGADINWTGLVYLIDTGSEETSTVSLAPMTDAGFSPDLQNPSGCFPNQLQSVTIRGDRAFVTSICASPRGPNSVKQMTHPVLSTVDLSSGSELIAPQNLSKLQWDRYTTDGLADVAPERRLPLVANDVAIDPTSGALLISANGTDAVFRAVTDAAGTVTSVGTGSKAFFNLAPASFAAADQGQNPIGIATAFTHSFAFVANDVSRSVTAIDLTPSAEEIAGETAADPVVVASTDKPVDAADQAALRGKRAFNTGLDRFSQDGQGWGACQSCHFEGLSDNVTWYFGRGPRQSTSLDGSFASNDPTDQRIFNWTAVFDEIADFEGVARGIDGGVGAIVHTISAPPVNGDRVSLTDTTLSPPAGASGLNGSAEQLMEDQSVLQTWADVKVYAQRVRSPRAPRGLDALKVAAGEALFSGAGGCAGCHGGAKWTVSKLFYTPSGATNEALKNKLYNENGSLVAAGFPAALLPANPGSQTMRSAVGGDQIQCVLRNVGTFGVSPAEINVQETKQDLGIAQGGAVNGNGYNSPSLLGMQVGAPYFHAGNARTLEESLGAVFTTHAAALADAGFLAGPTADDDREALAAYLLSVDEDAVIVPLPASPGADGGDFCQAPP